MARTHTISITDNRTGKTKLELNEIETLTHLVRAKAVEPGNFQGLYKNILSKLNKMFDEEYAEREKK